MIVSPVKGWDHPRGCGEKDGATRVPQLPAGSSPRVRGKGEGRWSATRSTGIIPAGAGKSRLFHRGSPFNGDHPRGCGEKDSRPKRTLVHQGSSPRVRGKELNLKLGEVPIRIIPAGAGKRSTPRPQKPYPGDHPRGCGEKIAQEQPRLSACRIIPAGAGKSSSISVAGDGSPDHPRGCGEKSGRSPRPGRSRGSSPRVRGKGPEDAPRRFGIRIIPAGAGKSARPSDAPR